MSEAEIEPMAPERGSMNEEEQGYADSIYAAMMTQSRDSERSLQQQTFRAGISDIGWCSTKLVRMLKREVPENVDMDLLKAWIGTWLGEGMEQAYKKARPEIITQANVEVHLKGERNTYILGGHPDIIDPSGVIIDAKSAAGLQVARRVGADQQKNFQRHLYGLGAWEAGYFGDLSLDEVRVGNAWVDRTGSEPGLHVQIEAFDLDVIGAATQWLDEVIYSWVNKQEARREPPREVCAVTCGFFHPCRDFDLNVTGLLTDPSVLAAVDLKVEGSALESRGKKMVAEAKAALQGIEGSTGEYLVSWTLINGTHVDAFDKASFRRLNVKKVK